MEAADIRGRKERNMQGQPVSPGIAMGRSCVYDKEQASVRTDKIGEDEIEKHLKRLQRAKRLVEKELRRFREKNTNSSAGDILAAQIEIVRDPELHKKIVAAIESELYSADFAIQKVFDEYLDILKQSGNDLMRGRMVDISDIRDRMVQATSRYMEDLNIEPGTIIFAGEVSPREVLQFADFKIKGLVMAHGGPTSHASIIARSMGIPSVVGIRRCTDIPEENDEVIVDGNEGAVIINPEQATVEKYKQKITKQEKRVKHLQAVLAKPSETSDGFPFTLRANIEFTEELENVSLFKAHGIGLLRTESIYLRREHFEDEEKQEAFYSTILESTHPYPVIIRLFDAGGDKFFNINSRESNPFLGWRGIRLLLDERDLLREQLKAVLLTAAGFPGRVRILVPMVSTLEEIRELKKELEVLQRQLQQGGVEIDKDIQLGVMVEVPSVAMQADVFAREVDFFSIGTNDLTQYTLAVDRGNDLISALYQQIHPAVWKLISLSAEAAKNEGIGIAVCGELASHPAAAACLMGMGIDDLSMTPTVIPAVKERLISHKHTAMERLAEAVLSAASVDEVIDLFEQW